jgi:hypothetical protein
MLFADAPAGAKTTINRLMAVKNLRVIKKTSEIVRCDMPDLVACGAAQVQQGSKDVPGHVPWSCPISRFSHGNIRSRRP